MSAETNADACVAEIVEHYRVAFTRHCTCGAPECAQPVPADPNDYRVLACTMLNALGVVATLLEESDAITARRLVAATLRYADPALVHRIDRDPDPRMSLERYLATRDDPEIEAKIIEELAETDEDVGASLVDPEEVDRLYAGLPDDVT